MSRQTLRFLMPLPPPVSLMFWTNWNELHPSIMRAALSGANVLTLIEKDIRTPNGLAIDHRAEKLYFSDATLDKIERCEYDGSHRYVSLWGREGKPSQDMVGKAGSENTSLSSYLSPWGSDIA